jgi:hypothetical protein
MPEDPNAILTFLSSLLERISKEKSREAWIMLVSSIAHTKLIFGDLAGTKVDTDECQKLLDDLDGVEPSVHAAYYEVAADYHKVHIDLPCRPSVCLTLSLGQSRLCPLLQEFTPIPRMHRRRE